MRTSPARGKALRQLEQIETVAAEMGDPVTISVAVKKGNKYVLAVFVNGQWKMNSD